MLMYARRWQYYYVRWGSVTLRCRYGSPVIWKLISKAVYATGMEDKSLTK